MKKIIIYIYIIIFMLPFSIKAYECSNSDIEKYQKLADNVSIIIEEQDDGSLSAIFSGVSKLIRIYNTKNKVYYWNLTPNEIGETKVNNLEFGETYRFEIYTFSEICLLKKFRTITINVPDINPFYEDEVCKNAKNYSLCQKWLKVNMTYEEFVNKVNKYIQDNSDKSNNENIDNTKDRIDFFEIYKKFYWPTFIGMICILALLIFLWIKENKKNKL